MATGGERGGVEEQGAGAVPGLTASLQQSDAVHKYMYACYPCSQQDIHIEATHFCPECAVCYCKACLCDHVVIGRSKVEQWGKAKHTECLRHPGFTVNLYCAHHGTMCCQLCSSADHRSCNKMESISAAAERHGIDRTAKLVKSMIECLEGNAQTLVKEGEMKLRLTHISNSSYANQLDELKQKIISEIDEVKKEALAGKQYNIKKFDMDIFIAKKIIYELGILKTSLEATDGGGEDYFIRVIQAKGWVENKLKEMENMLNAVVTGMFERLTVKEETEIQYSVGASIRSRSKMTDMRFSLETSDDKETCKIVGICQVANGNIIVADKGNSCLKQLDDSYTVISQFELSEKPSGLCVAGDSHVAVALENNTVMLLSVGDTFEKVRIVDIDISCRGLGQMAHHSGHIYIFDTIKCTCGRNYYNCTCETNVKVYEDKVGDSVTNITVNVGRGHISNSDHMLIAINADGDRVFVAHPCGYIVSYDNHGQVIDSNDYVYAEGRFLGLWIDNQGYVNVFRKTTDDCREVHVVKFLQEGLEEVEIASASFHDKINPWVVGFDRKLGRVVVCPGTIQVYRYVEKEGKVTRSVPLRHASRAIRRRRRPYRGLHARKW